MPEPHDGRSTTGPRREHTPIRPIWLCRVDGQPWPCGEARLRLRHEYADNRVGLAVYLATMLHDAVADLYRLNPSDLPPPAALWDRFLAWLDTGHHRPP